MAPLGQKGRKIQMLCAPLLALLASAPQTGDAYTIVEAKRTVAFAGKLGNRVEDNLIVERDGVRYRLEIGHRHTRFGNVGEPFSAGEKIAVHGTVVSGTILVMPGDVKRL